MHLSKITSFGYNKFILLAFICYYTLMLHFDHFYQHCCLLLTEYQSIISLLTCLLRNWESTKMLSILLLMSHGIYLLASSQELIKNCYFSR